MVSSREQSAAEIRARLASADVPVLIDVREPEEVAGGAIPGAVPIPRGVLETAIERAVPSRATPLVVYCTAGARSRLAAETLTALGYRDVVSLRGGISAWHEESSALSAPERRRYARHLVIPEVGDVGQAKLLASRVLLVGAGGLGSPAAYYLAAAGVGRLGIVDFDVVEESNLQRQILHVPARVGEMKTTSAKIALSAFNPGIAVETHDERVTSGNVERLVAQYDVIVDGSDNFATRYLLSDHCVRVGKPYVYGSVFRFEGQVSVFDPKRGGPCYRCLYPAAPPPELAPSCAAAGVLGVLPGIIGTLQATEALKLLLGIGASLAGRVLCYDALSGSFREFRLPRDPRCLCAGNSSATAPVSHNPPLQ